MNQPTPDPHAADKLRAAALLVRELAEGATHDGRRTWSPGHTLSSRSPVVVDDHKQPTVLIETWAPRLEAVNAYVAAMDPGLGVLLAELLDDHARRHDALVASARETWPADEEQQCRFVAAHQDAPALALARRLLGGGEDQ
ncbi:hypothetical protein [Streptomyces zaomyceticus]|uniref:hypothetical protein n=1 Tax=Streptomyces zaomyceticus TaxID=68286 RepID=UPI002E0D8453|nr:hypothetical protein OG237_20290 [Streptomyces zaomyceticus]